MMNSFIIFNFYALILTCRSSEYENGSPMNGFYTDGLDQALDKIEIVYPEKVSKDGSFVSYYLPHYYNLESLESRPKRSEDNSESDAIHFFVPIEGQKHQLELWPNLNFLAPGLVIERRDARDVDNVNKAKISQISQQQCHYNGRVVGKPKSRAALSTCYGLAGYIQLPAGEEYLIEPVKDSKPTYNKGNPHIMYKRSGIKDRQGNSNCLTKGSAKNALGDRLQWESIFGNQVKKEFSALDMNELMRDVTSKTPNDNIQPEVQSYPSNSLLPETLVKDNENLHEKENEKSLSNLQKNYQQNENHFDENISPFNVSQPYETSLKTSGKIKPDYGNKLKPKPLREELGSIKLPDVNLSPLKQLSNHQILNEHFVNGPDALSYENGKGLHKTDFKLRRVKRALSEELKKNEANKDVSSLKTDQNLLGENGQNRNIDESEFSYEKNNKINPQKMSNTKGSELKTNVDKLHSSKLKRDAQNKIPSMQLKANDGKKLNKDMQQPEYSSDSLIEKSHNSGINKEINDFGNVNIKNTHLKTDAYQDDMLNKINYPVKDPIKNPELTNNVNQKYSVSNAENNIKRDIHLDTSEKSWKSGEKIESSYPNENVDAKNYRDAYNADTKTSLLDRNSREQNLDSMTLDSKSKKCQSSKVTKDDNGDRNKDDIMVSALESVVRDMDKIKVKKEIPGGYLHLPPEDNISKNQFIHTNPLVKNDNLKYNKLDETLSDTEEKDSNKIALNDGLTSNSGIAKENEHNLKMMSEHSQSVEKSNKNNVDEIVIRIKTPDGTISEVKQGQDIDSEGLKYNVNNPEIDNENVKNKELMIDHKPEKLLAKNNLKNDAEKSKRGTDQMSEKEVQGKFINQDSTNDDEVFSSQDFNIIVEAPKDTVIDNNPKNKAKRDDNTIHLVIETEPEVKSQEGHNSETPGSNLFCQGRNCLEIKPIYLNDTKASLTSPNNTNSDNTKEKVIKKRDSGGDEFCGLTTTEAPLKCFDFEHKVFTLELMITVDYKVVKMHDDDDIENFILTIINMVSSNFDDRSLGFNLNVVLVRLIMLTTCIKELDSDRFNPEELLENFCTWQVLVNPGRDDHPHHHDLAIFVSKMEKCQGQVMGVSYMTSVCRPDKACIICVDEGLLLANTITHQIGHSLGADHDEGQNSGCGDGTLDGATYHMAPTITETSSAWSVCSRDAITQFVQTQGSWCLIDVPVVRSYNFPIMLPGQIYSAAQQCKLNFHMTAIPCSVGSFCNKLYCQITDKLCATKGDPPADGTFCASDMWCFHKQCVHVGRRPGAINGEWGPWTEWSLCTRSCGGGVSSSYRICNNPKPMNGGRYCIGERLRHKICQAKPCQGFTESFRDLQCKRTEDRPFRGKIHNWVQYQSLFINIECSLVCQNRKGDVVMRSPIVADGTPCKAGTKNRCIQGICRSVGCDYVIDSNAREDACGICHGNGTECKIIQGVFDEAVSKKGLIEFLRIPKDSGMVFVREIAPSTNTIVVSGSVNRVFYLNGLGAEDSMAGDVAFGLSHGVYEKRGGMERVFIRGPTKEDLIFYVFFRDLNKGIHYQYSTLEHDPTYVPRYLWQYLDWDPCSDPCSGGSQRARAKCVEDRGGVVDDKYCTESTRPLDIVRPCNDFPCQAKWWVSVWSDCICTGATNVMFRSVLCMRANDESGTRVEVVKESECTMAKKPPTQKPCNYSEEDTDCAKRSVSDDSMFQAHRDLRRAVDPRLAFSALSPVDSDMKLNQDPYFGSTNKEMVSENKDMKKIKTQTNKNVNSKEFANKLTNSKLPNKDKKNMNKVSPQKLQNIEAKQTEVSKNKPREQSLYTKNEDLSLLQKKGKQISKIKQKNSAALTDELKSGISKQAEDSSDNESGGKNNNNCATTEEPSSCPTEEHTTESPSTCRDTAAPNPHKKTTCCKTSPHRQFVVKTTLETTTIRPVAVKMDELNVNNFGLTVVPLDYSGKKKLLPQSDPEFINLGNVGQFGVGDELNATIISGQEALDLLEFARSNASEEPVILHEDMHN